MCARGGWRQLADRGMPLALGAAAAKAAGETAGRLRDGHGLSAEQADALLEIARIDVCKDALAEVDGLSAGLRDCALLVVRDGGASRRPAVTALNVLGELGRAPEDGHRRSEARERAKVAAVEAGMLLATAISCEGDAQAQAVTALRAGDEDARTLLELQPFDPLDALTKALPTTAGSSTEDHAMQVDVALSLALMALEPQNANLIAYHPALVTSLAEQLRSSAPEVSLGATRALATIAGAGSVRACKALARVGGLVPALISLLADADAVAEFQKAPPSSRRSAFASLRFDGVVPVAAEELQAALEQRRVAMQIINMKAGGDIDAAVFEGIEHCDTFIVFGSMKYGENTGNPACTYNECKFAQSKQKRIILIRMIPFDQEFEQLQARVIFGLNTLEL